LLLICYCFEFQSDSLGRGDLSDELGRENYDWQWSPINEGEEQPQAPVLKVDIAQDRSSDSGFEEPSPQNLQERPRQARLSDSGAEDTAYFFPSQTQNTKERRKRGRKAKKQGQAKRQIQNKSYDAINDEENQGGDEGTDKSERDSKYILIGLLHSAQIV
jgi:hypothetical protein